MMMGRFSILVNKVSKHRAMFFKYLLESANSS
jgi:hypothetical protein